MRRIWRVRWLFCIGFVIGSLQGMAFEGEIPMNKTVLFTLLYRYDLCFRFDCFLIQTVENDLVDVASVFVPSKFFSEMRKEICRYLKAYSLELSDGRGSTLIMELAKKDAAIALALVFKFGQRNGQYLDLNQRDAMGRTAIFIAAQYDARNAFSVLLDRGADYLMDATGFRELQRNRITYWLEINCIDFCGYRWKALSESEGEEYQESVLFRKQVSLYDVLCCEDQKILNEVISELQTRCVYTKEEYEREVFSPESTWLDYLDYIEDF